LEFGHQQQKMDKSWLKPLAIAVGLAVVLILFLFCGRTVVGATEPLNLDTKSHQVISPTTIDFSTATVLGLPPPVIPVTSVFGRTGAIVAANGDYSISQITGANAANWDTAYSERKQWDGGATGLTAATGRTSLGLVIGTNVEAWDVDLDTWATKTPYAGNVTVTTGKTLNSTNTLTFSGTDGSTLNIGGGGTLGSAAYTASGTYAQIASANSFTQKQTAASWETASLYLGNDTTGGGYPGLWLGNTAATETVTNYTLVATGGSTYLNANGGGVNIRVSGANIATFATGGASLNVPITGSGTVPTGGTTGQALVKNSATNYDVGWGSPTGVPVTKVVFLTSGTTYTPSASVRALLVECIGAGGGGGGVKLATSGAGEGGGGGGGGYAAKYVTGTIKGSYTIVLGGAGVGGSTLGGAGASGGATSFDSPSICTANGGGGGGGDTAAQTTPLPRGAGGNGGAGSVGDILMQGDDGGYGIVFSASAGLTGRGGGAAGFGGGEAAIGGGTGAAGALYGGGGSGAGAASTTGVAGGNGATGCIRVTEYF
jgi:hypothetical protein